MTCDEAQPGQHANTQIVERQQEQEHRRRKQQQQQHQHRRRSHAPRSRDGQSVAPVAAVAFGALSVYCTVKAGMQGYQHLRRRNLRHLVKIVSPVLDDMGIQYWADFGTLLGMYREKDIILHDNDADIVLLDPDWDALLPKLRSALPGCRVFTVVPSEDASIRWIRVLSGVGVMDLYGGYYTPGAPTVSIPQGHGDLCDVPAGLVFPLGRMTFQGTSVSVPGDVTGVLTHRYGETFMVPRYMDKGRDSVEQGKAYARLLGLLGKAGLRV